MRNLTGIVFEDGLCCFAGWGVKKHDSCYILPEWFSNTSNMLRQHPHADAIMAGTEAEIDQLTCAAFYVFQNSTVIENKECVCFLKEVAS